MSDHGGAQSPDSRDYRTIFQSVSDGLILHHPETGEILDVNDRFAEMLGYTREEALELSVDDVTADGNPVVHAKEPFLRLALRNLTENAVEHTESSVRVTAACDGGRAVFTISDDGPGIPESELEPIVQSGEHRLTHTTGIGLWIAKWSIDELGGDLTFDSSTDGTTVRVRLPVER